MSVKVNLKQKKVMAKAGFIISVNEAEEWHVYRKEEWSYGEGMRYPEFECGSLKECYDNITSCNS